MDHPTPIILDTDIGDDVDDAYAVTLLAALPTVTALGVTTCFGETAQRAQIAAKLLEAAGRPDLPVCAGRAGVRPIGRQHEWASGYDSPAIQATSAVEFMVQEVEKAPGQVVLVAIGPLTNLGDFISSRPDLAPKVRAISIMGGSVFSGEFPGRLPALEWNLSCDPHAAQIVFKAGIPLTMAGLEATLALKFDANRQERLFGGPAPAAEPLRALTKLWGEPVPTLYDPMALAHAAGHVFCKRQRKCVVVRDDGMTVLGDGPPNVDVLVEPQVEAFLEWFVETLEAGSAR